MDENDEGSRFCEEDIDQILQRRATTITIESEGKGSTFSKASFVASENRNDIALDDPEFWEKWAKKADIDVDTINRKVGASIIYCTQSLKGIYFLVWIHFMDAPVMFTVSWRSVLVRLSTSPTEHSRHWHSQSPQADPSVLQFTRWRWRPVWSGQWRWVPTCQFQTVTYLPTFRPPQQWGLRTHWLFPGGKTPACLWVLVH